MYLQIIGIRKEKKIFFKCVRSFHNLFRQRKSDTDSLNSDWHHMYANMDPTLSPTTPAGISGAHIQDTPSSSLVEYSMPEKNSVQGGCLSF